MKPSTLTEAEFLARFGDVYADSSWVAEAVWPAVRAGEEDSLSAMAEGMQEAVDHAPHEVRLAMLHSHPGVLTEDDPAELRQLGAEYRARFGFAYLVARQGLGSAQLAADLRRRLRSTAEAERVSALLQLHRLAALRLADLFHAPR